MTSSSPDGPPHAPRPHLMQAFVPFRELDRCAEVVDDPRLGNQHGEVIRILPALSRDHEGRKSQPAVRM